MINSAKEAKDLLVLPERNGSHSEAKGYLAALEGPEVKTLLERLDTLANALPPNAISMNIGKALSQFREAVKK